MASANKEKKKQLFANAAAMNPALRQAKTWITVIAFFWIITRIAVLLLQSYCVGKEYLIINTAQASNYASMAVTVLFAIGIINGTKGFAILSMVGGVVMVIQTFTGDVGIMLSPLYDIPLALRLYTMAFLLTSYGQLAGMLLILLPKKCRTYFAVMTAINKQITTGTMQVPKE